MYSPGKHRRVKMFEPKNVMFELLKHYRGVFCKRQKTVISIGRDSHVNVVPEWWTAKRVPLTSLVEPSLSHNTDFIHAGAENCLGWEGAADKLLEMCKLFLLVECLTVAQIQKHLYNTWRKGTERDLINRKIEQHRKQSSLMPQVALTCSYNIHSCGKSYKPPTSEKTSQDLQHVQLIL